MKVNHVMLIAFASILLCSYEPVYEPETSYKPILLTREKLEASIQVSSARALQNPGKIYMKANYVYIVEKYKGIHIIDNQDRSNPVNLKFIEVPGCVDLAIKGNTLYADNAVDLVAISISSLSNVSVTQRIKNTFPDLYPPDMDYLPYEYSQDKRPNNTIIVAWEPK